MGVLIPNLFVILANWITFFSVQNMSIFTFLSSFFLGVRATETKIWKKNKRTNSILYSGYHCRYIELCVCQLSSELDYIFLCKKGKFEDFFCENAFIDSNVKAIFFFHQIFKPCQLHDSHRATDYQAFWILKNGW